jgi:hypothetical protein
MIESYNDKRITLTVHNIKRLLKNVKAIEYQIQKELNQKGLNQDTTKKGEQKFQNIIISHINIDLALMMKVTKTQEMGLYVAVKDIHIE